MSLWSESCFLAASCQSQHLSVKKKTKKKWKKCARNGPWSDPIAFEDIYDQIQLRSKSPLIRQKCARSRLWSDPIALEIGSDQTQVRSNPPMIRLFRPKWPLIRPSPDHDQTVVRSNFRKDPVFSVWEHTGVRSTGSDQKSIWVWTSTWDIE